MIDIAPAGREHIPEVLEIERACFSPPWTENGFLFELENSDSFFIAARDGKSVAGFCISRRMAEEAEVYRIAVREKARRLGIASALLAEAVGWAQSAGIEKLFLEVRKSNLPAIELYKKTGFTVSGERKNYYSAPSEDAVIMEKEVFL